MVRISAYIAHININRSLFLILYCPNMSRFIAQWTEECKFTDFSGFGSSKRNSGSVTTGIAHGDIEEFC